MSKSYTLRQIATHIRGEVEGDGALLISGIAPLATAGPSDITYLEGGKYLKQLGDTKAAAVIVGPDVEASGRLNLVRVSQPSVAWCDVVELWNPARRVFADVSRQAILGSGVEIGDGVGIGPGACIGDRATIGRGTEIYPGVTVGADSQIGEDCILYAGVHVYHTCTVGDRVIIHSGAVIGADGFGFAQETLDDPEEPLRHRKTPQVGTVLIEDDVEIGACTTIDRGALDATIIGRGTKIDNLVMVGHNCRVGRHCLLVAQVGLSGSIEVGDYVTIAGQAGLAGHLKVGSRSIIGAKAGVLKDVEEGQVMIGSPALPGGLAQRAYAQIQHLPEYRKTINKLQKRLGELEKRLSEQGSNPG